MVKQVKPAVWAWRWFSEAKGYYFNGTAVLEGSKKVLIDPVQMNSEKEEVLRKLGPFDAIYLTNKDHERVSHELRQKWKIPIGIHEQDAAALQEAPDFLFRDGDKLLCGLEVIHLEHQKSPGECAFYLESRKVLILGDALIGVPQGQLRLLPPEKYADIGLAKNALRKLNQFETESLILGDGVHIFDKANRVLEKILKHSEKMNLIFEKG